MCRTPAPLGLLVLAGSGLPQSKFAEDNTNACNKICRSSLDTGA